MAKTDKNDHRWRVCETCGFRFFARHHCKTRIAKYCSRKCSGVSNAKIKECIECGQQFYNWKRQKFCSDKCQWKWQRGRPLSEAHKQSLRGPRPHTAGDKHHQWKGDKVGYHQLHKWVRKVLGEPKKCQHCGANNRKMHYANVSGQYLRKVKDWMPLCVSCHKKYDLKRIQYANQRQKDNRAQA